MSEYQAIARKFRPQFFKDVMGQDPVITTLKNALRLQRVAQGYIFSGSRGTGKTTLARLLAKALNCQQISSDYEPCNACSSCREIVSGSSLDVIEIDGASHRGIDDIRRINETIGYAATSAFKVYIIDEVHMLTKEAFNALLKTLEEPPPKVKFFFATTEPHKIPATILSRCQRFHLNRISFSQIVVKLQLIAKTLGAEIEEEALILLAQRAEGGLRDAESLLDQILSFEEGLVTANSVIAALGLMPRDLYFEIDCAGKEGNFAKAFAISDRLFSEGKELIVFLEGLTDHIRNLLVLTTAKTHPSFSYLAEEEKKKYIHSASLYSQEQCFDLLEYLIEAQQKFRTTFSKTALETILLHVMRSHFRLSAEQLVRRLQELEKAVQESEKAPPSIPTPNPNQNQSPSPSPIAKAPLVQQPSLPAPISSIKSKPSMTEDPTPTPADFGKKPAAVKKESVPSPLAKPVEEDKKQRPVYEYDTLLHFAAVELEGRLQKN
jgi:DNA polymerase III subunit gamma/tau